MISREASPRLRIQQHKQAGSACADVQAELVQNPKREISMNPIPGQPVPLDYTSFGPTTYQSFSDAQSALKEVGSCPEQEVQDQFQRLIKLLMTISECLHTPTPFGEGTARYALHKMVTVCPHSDWRILSNLGALDLLLAQILADVRTARNRVEALKHFVDSDLKVQRLAR